MRLITLPQAEAATEVRCQHLLLLNARQQRLIDLLLVLHPRALRLALLLLAVTEELLLAALFIRFLVPLEVIFTTDFVDGGLINALDVYRGLGGDDIAGVDSAEWDAVDFEGAGYEQYALVEDLDEDDAFAAESAGEEDEDFAGCEGCSGLVWVDRFAGL